MLVNPDQRQLRRHTRQRVAGGPPPQAGLAAGDTITSLAGQTVDSPSTLTKLISRYHPATRCGRLDGLLGPDPSGHGAVGQRPTRVAFVGLELSGRVAPDLRGPSRPDRSDAIDRPHSRAVAESRGCPLSTSQAVLDGPMRRLMLTVPPALV